MKATIELRDLGKWCFPMLALDPGVTTGWAYIECVKSVPTSEGWSEYTLEWVTGEWAWPDDAAKIEQLVAKCGIILWEDFLLYGGKAQAQTGSRFEPVQVIGYVKGLVVAHKSRLKMKEFYTFRAVETKTAAPDDVLEVYFPGLGKKIGQTKDRHKRDAMRVMTYFLMTHCGGA